MKSALTIFMLLVFSLSLESMQLEVMTSELDESIMDTDGKFAFADRLKLSKGSITCSCKDGLLEFYRFEDGDKNSNDMSFEPNYISCLVTGNVTCRMACVKGNILALGLGNNKKGGSSNVMFLKKFALNHDSSNLLSVRELASSDQVLNIEFRKDNDPANVILALVISKSDGKKYTETTTFCLESLRVVDVRKE